jgi:hypothetical protein
VLIWEFWAGTRRSLDILYSQISLTPLPSGHQGAIHDRQNNIEEKWLQQSETAKSEAEKLPHGKEREALARKARQLKTAFQINQWLSSPELKPPN